MLIKGTILPTNPICTYDKLLVTRVRQIVGEWKAACRQTKIEQINKFFPEKSCRANTTICIGCNGRWWDVESLSSMIIVYRYSKSMCCNQPGFYRSYRLERYMECLPKNIAVYHKKPLAVQTGNETCDQSHTTISFKRINGRVYTVQC